MQYVWSARYIDAPILRDRDAGEGGNLGKTGSGLDERLYYLTDANMNVTTLTDTGGDAVERYVYDPYGKVTVLDADWSADADGKSDYANSILFGGYYRDNETGLYHVRHRYYHPPLGRWLQQDPIGYAGEMSLYLYANADPVWGLDPLGLVGVTFHEDRNDEETKKDKYSLGYTRCEQKDLVVTAHPIRPKSGSGVCCNLKPEATIHWGIHPDLPSEAEVVGRANEENYKQMVKELRSEAASKELHANRSAVKAGVITRESVEAHERHHINQHKAFATKAWEDVSKSLSSESTRYPNEQACNQVAQRAQENWRQKYWSSWSAKSKQEIEDPAYQAGRKLLEETAEKIEKKIEEQEKTEEQE